MKPVIGISCGFETTHTNMSVKRLAGTHEDFLKMVRSSGGTPLLIPQGTAEEAVLYVEKIDALILSSGRDMDPSTYGDTLKVEYSSTISGFGVFAKRPMYLASDCERDLFEIACFKECKKHLKPVLGICRGLQVINVAEGGTLMQEIPEEHARIHFVHEDGWIPYHEFNIVAGSILRRIFERDRYVTSSIHHQAILELGRDLMISGFSSEGIIEVIEGTNLDHFVIGVQGHLEKTIECLPLYKKLIDAFIRISSQK